jgi:hypothetical protein
MYRSVRIQEAGGPEVLLIEDVAVSDPGPASRVAVRGRSNPFQHGMNVRCKRPTPPWTPREEASQ